MVLPSISLLSFWKHSTLRFLFLTWMCQLRGSLFNITMNHSTNFCEKRVKCFVTLCCLLMTPYFNMKGYRFCLEYIFYKSLCRQITGMIRNSGFQCHGSKPSSILHLNTFTLYFMDLKTLPIQSDIG